MKRLNLTFLTIASFVTMTMCSCIAYRPQVVEIPLIHEKGELQINGSIGLSAPFGDGYLGTTVSYGATDWLAVQGHANWNGAAGGYGQVAAGAFHIPPPKSAGTLLRRLPHCLVLNTSAS